MLNEPLLTRSAAVARSPPALAGDRPSRFTLLVNSNQSGRKSPSVAAPAPSIVTLIPPVEVAPGNGILLINSVPTVETPPVAAASNTSLRFPPFNASILPEVTAAARAC